MRLPRPRLPLFAFLLAIAAANTLLFHWPLARAASASLDLSAWSGWAALSTLFVLQFTLTLAMVSLTAVVSVRAAKVVAAVMLVANAVALYFIDRYGVLLDKSMMGNVANTNTAEAMAYLDSRLFVHVALLGVLPALIALAVLPTRPMRWHRAVFALLVPFLGIGYCYANAASWLWIDQHAARLGGLVLPWSYVVNLARHETAVSRTTRPRQALPAATVANPHDVIVVLVIGESARAADFSLYGYGRATNPRLAAAGAVALGPATSCATYTTESLHCMLSAKGSKTPLGDDHEYLPSWLQRNGVEVTWRENNSGEPPMKVARFEIAPEIRKTCTADCGALAYDDVLLQGLDARLRSPATGKKLVVLHTSGSHGPQYFTRYPPGDEKFRPACHTVDVSDCGHDELLNAYDNTILYTDGFLARVIERLQALGDVPTVMVYVSDHGESLGEHGLYLHGTPVAIAPDVQKRIPFIVWMSPAFEREHRVSAAQLNTRGPLSHDNVFHSVTGALGLAGPAYRRSLDIFATDAP